MKAYTDLEQSNKLAEILPIESADMYYEWPNKKVHFKDDKYNGMGLSCWSLAALIGVASTYCGRLEITLRADKNYNIFAVSGDIVFRSFDDHPNGFDNPVDACVAMVEKLHELNMKELSIEEKARRYDNAEPKFNANVGDWLIHNERKHIVKVIHATPLIYEVVNKFGDYHTITNNAIENNYHLWTIQDAKDGDVLATDDGNIFVFDGTVEEDKYPFAYYGLTRSRFESYDRRLPFTHNNVHPATKEQREQLEKAMADAGYTFDFEKKELKKIEKI